MQSEPERKQQLSVEQYYELARRTAREKRSEFGIVTKDINIPVLKRICKKEGIKVDLKENIGSTIRAAYFFDEDGCSILLKKSLPSEPKLFALAHELKHHFLDRELIASGEMKCGEYNRNKTVEIGAEIFAAEFLFPESEMKQMLASMNITARSCTENSIVDIKRSSPVPVSYTFICKRLVRFGLITNNQFAGTQFQKLEDILYPPIYKQAWFKAYRARKKVFKTNQS